MTDGISIMFNLIEDEGLIPMITFNQFRNIREVAKKENTALSPTPSIVVLKRRATRVMPDGTSISTYYSSELQKHVILPTTY